MSRYRLLLALLFALAAGVFLLMRLGVGASSARNRLTDGSEIDGSRPDGAVSATRIADADAGSSGRTARTAASPAEQRAPFAPIVDATPGFVRLLVLDHKTLAPIEGAEVFAWDAPREGAAFTGPAPDWIGPDPERTLREHGVRSMSDADGMALVPDPRGTLLVVARKESVAGWASFGAGEIEPFQVTIAPQSDLAVRVFDARGAAAPKITIGLGRASTNNMEWNGRTDDDGRLVVRNVQALLEGMGYLEEHAVALRVLVDVDPPIERWLDPRELPKETIEFRLPPGGTLRLRVIDASGALAALDGHIVVAMAARAASADLLVAEDPAQTEAPLEGGRAEINGVGLGMRLNIGVVTAGGGNFHQDVDGPKSPGEIVDVELKLPENFSVLTGRALDEHGQPIASVDLELRSWVMHGTRSYFTAVPSELVHTDDKGRFRWSTRMSRNRHTKARLVLVRDGAAPLQADLPLELQSSSPNIELGDVVLRAEPAIASGIALDAAQRPLAGVLVSAHRPSREKGQIVGEPLGTSIQARTGADGRFALYGPCIDANIVLVAGIVDHDLDRADAERPYPCGGGGEIVLHFNSSGRVEGFVLVDPELVEVQPTLSLKRGQDDVGALELWRDSSRWHFVFVDVPAGNCVLEATDPEHDNAQVAEVHDIVVRAGNVTHDPRLQPLDLRGKLTKPSSPGGVGVRLTIVDGAGRPLPRGWVSFVDEDGFQEWPWAGGGTTLPPGSQGEIAVWAPGCRIVRRETPRTAQRIVLPAALQVRFVINVPDDVRAVHPRFVVAITLATDGEDAITSSMMSRTREITVDERAEAVFDAPLPGAWNAAVDVSTIDPATGANNVHCTPSGPEGFTFEIVDRDGEQRVVFTPTKEAWDECRIDLGLPVEEGPGAGHH